MRKRICIISFSTIAQDARVLRQIEYLSAHYSLTVIGYGNEPALPEGCDWKSVPETTRFDSFLSGIFLTLARILPLFYEVWYWQKPRHQMALQYAEESRVDAYYANEWGALPVAVKASIRKNQPVTLDLHEYSPEASDARWWLFLFAPAIRFFLRKYVPTVSAAITVSPSIAQRYCQTFPRDWLVIRNVPKYVAAPEKPQKANIQHIRLIHHGAALRNRHLETMIDAIVLCDSRFVLDFMFIGDPTYISELKVYAERVAPNRVHFCEPVSPSQVVGQLTKYDMGFFVLKPTHYNQIEALPNKLFDFIGAGLAVCIGPSPAMAEIVNRYEVGCVAPTFNPSDVAATLNNLTSEQILSMQQSSRLAAKELNADVEMGTLVDLYQRLLAEDHASNTSRNPIS